MQGDERVRHCSECNLNVYNFSAMSQREIRRLLLAKNERLCARWYRRSDGTIITADCPVGFRGRVRKISLAAGTALSALFSMSPAAAQTLGKASDPAVQIENSGIGSGVIIIRAANKSGAVIQKAQVTVLDSANQSVAEGQTDEFGKFQTPGLKPGPYSVRVVFPGFGRSDTYGIIVAPAKKWGTMVQMRLDSAADMGWVVAVPDMPELKRSGDAPFLFPPAPAADAFPAPKPNTIRRSIFKNQGITK
jgi:hypothetical protein